MNEVDRLHQESSRGDRAKELLESELMQEARHIITTNLHDEWEASPARATKEREYLHMQLKAFNEVFRHLQSVLETGKMARQTLKEKVEKWNRKRANPQEQ